MKLSKILIVIKQKIFPKTLNIWPQGCFSDPLIMAVIIVGIIC